MNNYEKTDEFNSKSVGAGDLVHLPELNEAETIADKNKLLTKNDLVRIDQNTPIWRRLRIALLVGFWIFWLSLLVVLILIVVLHPECPYKPKLNFWQSKVGYALDPFAFKDGNNDCIGDFKGLKDKLSYFVSDLGIGFVILTNVAEGYLANTTNKVGGVTDFQAVDKNLGSEDELRDLIRQFHKKNIEVILPIDLNANILKEDMTLFNKLLSANGSPEKEREIQDIVIETAKKWIGFNADGVILRGIPLMNSYMGIPVKRVWNAVSKIIELTRIKMEDLTSSSSRARALMIETFRVDGDGDKCGLLKLLISHDCGRGAHLVLTDHVLNAQTLEEALYNLNGCEDINVAYVTATTNKPRTSNTIKTALSFLNRGTPIIYYGSEIGFTCNGVVELTSIYPMGRKPESLIDPTWILPMPWDRSGTEFTNANATIQEFNSYISACNPKDTVISSLAVGREDSHLHFVKELIKLKETPSVLWGDVTVKYFTKRIVSSKLRWFSRMAQDFPSVAVVINYQSSVDEKPLSGSVLDLSELCPRVKVRLVFPKNSTLKEGDKMDSDYIYIAESSQPTFFVFECL